MRTNASTFEHYDFLQEAEALQMLDHPNIVRLRGVCLADKPWLLIEDFVRWGDLANVLRTCTAKVCAGCFMLALSAGFLGSPVPRRGPLAHATWLPTLHLAVPRHRAPPSVGTKRCCSSARSWRAWPTSALARSSTSTWRPEIASSGPRTRSKWQILEREVPAPAPPGRSLPPSGEGRGVGRAGVLRGQGCWEGRGGRPCNGAGCPSRHAA